MRKDPVAVCGIGKGVGRPSGHLAVVSVCVWYDTPTLARCQALFSPAHGFSQVAFLLHTRAYGARFSREMVVFLWRFKRHKNTTISLKNGSQASRPNTHYNL